MQTAQDSKIKKDQIPPSISSSPAGKEGEPIGGSEDLMSGATPEVELPKEVKEAGVEHISGMIELPPDVKRLGVSPVGQSLTSAQTVVLPPVVLPISDHKVIAGLHASVTSALAWLTTWCIKKLRKAHIALKVVGGKIIRVRV